MIKSGIFTLLLTISLVITFFGEYNPENKEQYFLKINDLCCYNCVNTIRTTLKNIEGVEEVSINENKQIIEIVFNPSLINIDKLKRNISEKLNGVETSRSSPNFSVKRVTLLPVLF